MALQEQMEDALGRVESPRTFLTLRIASVSGGMGWFRLGGLRLQRKSCLIFTSPSSEQQLSPGNGGGADNWSREAATVPIPLAIIQ